MSKKILILMGHPHTDSMCGTLALAYKEGAEEVGYEVRIENIGEMKFDPILHDGYRSIQELEPDLKKFQEDIKWADHFVLLYPMWWSAMPAVLKGLFDRVWLPGFAFHFNKGGMGWHKLLKGKTARVIVTMDSWPFVSRFLFGDSTNEIARGVLGFAGFHPVKVRKFGPVKTASESHKLRWERKMHKWGMKGK